MDHFVQELARMMRDAEEATLSARPSRLVQQPQRPDDSFRTVRVSRPGRGTCGHTNINGGSLADPGNLTRPALAWP